MQISNLKMTIQNKKYILGFTLIELTIVMAITALLAGIGLNAFNSSQVKGRDTRRKADLVNLTKALDLYYNDYGAYPNANGGKVESCYDATDTLIPCDWGEGPFEDVKGTVYSLTLPLDPKSANYQYYYVSDGTSYKLYAYLEGDNITDSYGSTDCDATTATVVCNFGIASSNEVP